MMNRTMVVLAGVLVVGLAGGYFYLRASGASRQSTSAFQTMEAVDAQLAAKAESGCWFKVKNQSSRSEEVRLWQAATSVGASTVRLGELLIVTGALEPPVHEDRFYGCSLFEYTAGSPVVMTALTSRAPVRADNLIPFGFSPDGTKQQR
ncbi:MAG: hypothetical protein QM736_15565 [Vicinamibacterales bacterium]